MQIVRLQFLPFEEEEKVEQTREEPREPAERWKMYKEMREEKESGSLYEANERFYANTQQFLKLLEPPALFSSVPDFPDIAPELLIQEPVPNSLPVKPESRGECLVLLNDD